MLTHRTWLFIVLGFGICFAVFDSPRAMAQKGSNKLGVTGGFSSMTYAGENASDAWERRTGKTFGVVYLGILPDKLVKLQGEARYVQKGARAKVQDGAVTVKDKLHYVDVALLGKLPLPLSRSVIPNLLGGVSSNVGFGGVRTWEGPQGTATRTIRPGNSTQWALVFGAGLDFGWYAPVTLSVDARYTYGLNSAPTEGFSDVEAASFRNQGVMLNAAIAFTL